MKKRVGIYARVSTTDKQQDPETQLRQLREYARRREFNIAAEYTDHASGKRDDRPHFKRLLEDVRRRKIDVVLVWRYDRFARSTQSLINALTEFQSLGVDFISYQEGTDTTTPQGKLVFSIMAGLAEFESSLISERVKAGMERARAQGKRIGRSPMSPEIQKRIAVLYRQRPQLSIRTIAREVGFTKTPVGRYIRKLEEGQRSDHFVGIVRRRR